MALKLPVAPARVAGTDHTAAAPWLAKPQFGPADCVPEESVGAYQAKLILWNGYYSVHPRFSVDQIAPARAEHPGVNIIHPECRLEVVQAADCDGSTGFIIDAITAAPAGTTWGVGTEFNLVNRLNAELPNKHVFCLDPVNRPRPTMYRVHPAYVLRSLLHLAQGRVVNLDHGRLRHRARRAREAGPHVRRAVDALPPPYGTDSR